ncbi:unnamed protein product [Microthlaspi erraticum]|uniref:FKB95-like N-terminal Kelch domain-containing protein n=1 Tax=Microthlaspi erraticum TaxID=1685480 RepID=A0A6D2IRA9_9BRAS|nr:unnamed protein product [Microthlaspi erraticum]
MSRLLSKFIGSYPRALWYTLCLKPNQTLTNDTYGYVLARVPIPSSPRVRFQGLVAVGSNIYGIKESSYFAKEEDSSSNVSILDCHTHTWREAPSLPVKLSSLSASVLDGNIYVAGRSYKDGESSLDSLRNTFEVFDTEAQSWDAETIPWSETKCSFYSSRSACINGKFHVKTSTEVVAYNSKEVRWDLVNREMSEYMKSDFYCVIENVLYSASYGGLIWYDTEVSMWKELKGLVGLPEFSLGACVRLADYGGKMAVLWERDLFGYKNIWCAEITLERCGYKICGKVEWFGNVLTVPKSCSLMKVLAVAV